MSRLPLAFLALVLAGPALADGMPGPVRHGGEGADRGWMHRPYGGVGPRGRVVRAHGRVALAPPDGPVYLAWPEPAEVRVPIYNRPGHLPPSW